MNIYDLVRIARLDELKYGNDNKPYIKFSVAQNDYKKHGHFYSCVAFNKTAELISGSCHKGDRILIDGQWWNNNYEKPDGTKVYSEIINVNAIQFIEKKGFNDQDSEDIYNSVKPRPEQKKYENIEIDEDSQLPF